MSSSSSSAAKAELQDKVIGDLTQRYTALDEARQQAANTGKAIDVINAVQDLPRLSKLNTVLLHIAKNPFGVLPASYASMQGSVAADTIDAIGSPGVFELYERAVKFSSFVELGDKLRAAIAAFPDLRPRLTPTLDAASARAHLPGPAYLYYSGCCIAGSPVSRARDDLNSSGRLVTRLLSLWDVKQVLVFRLKLPGVAIDTFEFRGNRALQREEHAVIAMRFPHSLNSAPGGYHHDYRLDIYAPAPWPAVPKQPVDVAMQEEIRAHLTGMAAFYAQQPGSKSKAEQALLHEIDAATPRFLIRGRTPVVAVTKDVTQEGFEYAHSELGYRQRLVGPGPRATNDALVQQHGVDPLQVSTEERMALLPPVTDLYTDLQHWWLFGVIFLRRFLRVHRWPAVIWTESVEVALVFRYDALASVQTDGAAEDFFSLRTDHPCEASATRKGDNVRMSSYAGDAFLSDVGEGRWVVVLANYHRGCIKYDPELAQDRWALQLAADAAHQARVGAYLQFITDNDYPHDFATMKTMLEVGESAVPGPVRADLGALRRRVQEREEVIIGLRTREGMRAAAERGASIGGTSDRMKDTRESSWARHEKAQGAKRAYGVDDPRRIAQFQRLLAEDTERRERGLAQIRHPCRPQDMDDSAWRAWFVQLDPGVEIEVAAGRVGKLQIEDGQARYEKHLGEWRKQNPGTGFMHATDAAGALLSLAKSATWVPFATEFVACRSCAATAVGVHPASQLQRTLHRCSDVSTTNAYLRDPLDPIELNWAGDALDINALVDVTEDLPLLRFSAEELLTRAGTDLSHYKWASVVPKDYPLLDVGEVLVHADASEDWQLANAIGQALAISPGVEALERMGVLYEGVVGVRALLNGLDIADDGADLYACFEPDCYNVRPYWTASHTCRDATGAVIKNDRGSDRTRTTFQVVGRIGSFHDLPSSFKTRVWASFVCSANPLNVPAALFTWGCATNSQPPITPNFGPGVVSVAPKPLGKRAQKRATRAQDVASAAGAGAAASGSGIGSSSVSGGASVKPRGRQPDEQISGNSGPLKRRRF